MNNPKVNNTYEQLNQLVIDDNNRFSRKLANCNRWTQAYAQRVETEYKRFVALAAICGPVVPSIEVDKAWHLHLTYTRSYWDEMCGEILRKPLHHNPGTGEPDNIAMHKEGYEETLRLYEKAFGESAPADIWPDAHSRFNQTTRYVNVNNNDYWLFPKSILRTTLMAMVLVLGVTLLSACEYAGVDISFFGALMIFLFLYLVVTIVAALFSSNKKHSGRGDNGSCGTDCSSDSGSGCSGGCGGGCGGG